MSLSKLIITHFRNIKEGRLASLSPGFNLITGANGSGKTSILESIHYLSLAKSFKSTLPSRIITHGEDKLTLFTQCHHESKSLPVGVERTLQGKLSIHIAEESVDTIADLALLMPLQIINSHSFNLLESGPSYRRKFVDWGAFYQKKQFLQIWREYAQILKQRNAALRLRQSPVNCQVWTDELIIKAMRLDDIRRSYLEILLPILTQTVQNLMPQLEFDVQYESGWSKNKCLADVLKEHWAKDIAQGYTHAGPHRADLSITVSGQNAKDFLSRGQQKLFICAMILSQGKVLKVGVNKSPIYLIDDLPAELDFHNRSKIIAALSAHESQVFLTTTDLAMLFEQIQGLPHKMFHVEHGVIREES